MLSRRLARRSKARLHPEPRPDDPNPPAYLKPTIESYGRPPTDENATVAGGSG
jgi:hypothetical protein